MLLNFGNGSSFAIGATTYGYADRPDNNTSFKVMLNVTIDGQPTEAILDTGAPYAICSPALAEILQLDLSLATQATVTIRGIKVNGYLHRLDLTIIANQGDDLSLQVTAFIPSGEQPLPTAMPSFLGMYCCLERIRFALDPTDNIFYFGYCE